MVNNVLKLYTKLNVHYTVWKFKRVIITKENYQYKFLYFEKMIMKFAKINVSTSVTCSNIVQGTYFRVQ